MKKIKRPNSWKYIFPLTLIFLLSFSQLQAQGFLGTIAAAAASYCPPCNKKDCTKGGGDCNTFGESGSCGDVQNDCATSASGSKSPGKTILDLVTRYDTITLTEDMCVDQLKVGLDLSHPWLADLTIILISPSGTQATLLDGQCPGGTNANVVFDDTANPPVCSGGDPALDGPIQPQDPLSTFKGEDVAGDWVLCITDNAPGDEGQWNNWSIEASNPYNDKCIDRVYVDVKVFLQGPYVTAEGLMTFNLTAASLVTLFEIYSSLGYIHEGPGGGEFVLAAKLDPFGKPSGEQIVDWVILELRDKADSTKVIATRAAFVTRDATVVDLDCNPAVCFLDVPPGAYFVSVRHRNHLGVMTLDCVTLDDDRATAIVLDFTTAVVAFTRKGPPNESGFTNSVGLPVWGTDAMVEMVPGIYGLWGGNAYFDDKVKYQGTNNDNDIIKNDILGQPGNLFNLLTYTYSDYREIDVNLDGSIKYQGANNDSDLVKNNILAHPGNLFNLLTYIIIEQLP